MKTLYEMKAQYKMLLDTLRSSPDDEAVIAALAEISDEIEDKAEGYAMVRAELKAFADKLKAEEKRMSDLRRSAENNIKRLENNLMEAMKETGKEKFTTNLFSFSIANNGGKQPLVVDVNVMELPEELQEWDVKPNNEAIRKYIEETGDLTYAHLEERGQHLSIR